MLATKNTKILLQTYSYAVRDVVKCSWKIMLLSNNCIVKIS